MQSEENHLGKAQNRFERTQSNRNSLSRSILVLKNTTKKKVLLSKRIGLRVMINS